MNLLKYIFREEPALENKQEGKNNHLTMSPHTSAVILFKQLLRFISERALAAPQSPRRHSVHNSEPHRTSQPCRTAADCEEMTTSLGGKNHVVMGLAEVKSVAMDTRFGLQRDEGQEANHAVSC